MTGLTSLKASKRSKPAVDVNWARILPHQPAFIKRKKSRGRYAVGVRYEREVQDHLSLLALAMPSVEYIESPWIEFCDKSGKRWCQPDLLLVDKIQKAVVIGEVKYQHTVDAWWQLRYLYQPVVAVLFPHFRPIALIEIVHWHDPQIQWPERYDLTDSPFRIPHANKVAVCIFNPKRRRSAHSSSNGLAIAGYNDSEGSGEKTGTIGHEERPERTAGVV